MEGGIRNGKQDEKWGEGACWPSNWTDYDQLTFWCVLSLGRFRRSSSAPVGGGGGILCYPLLSKHANQSRLFGPCHCCCCCCCHVVDSIDWIYSSSWNSRPRWWRRCREHSIRRLLWKTGHNLLSARRRSVFHRNNQIIITISTRARERGARERASSVSSFESGCAPSSGKQPLGWWTIIYILFISPARYVPVVSNFQAPSLKVWFINHRPLNGCNPIWNAVFLFWKKNNLLSASLARF